MRRTIRTRLLATFMVAVATMTFAGCKAAEPTQEFSEPAISSSISYSMDGPKVINNQGKFSYKLDEAAYSKILADASPTEYATGTGHSVYSDGQGMFIVSGYDKVYLQDGVIPADKHQALRTEESGLRLFVQEDTTPAEQIAAVEQFTEAQKQAADLLANAGQADSKEGLTVIVNGMILENGADKATVEDGVVYVDAGALFSSVENIRIIQNGAGSIEFVITNPNDGSKANYMIDKDTPETVISADLSESLSSDFPLVLFVGDDVYIDAAGMADVLDWEVKVLDNNKVVSIVTDPTIAEGKAVTVEDCRIVGGSASVGGSGEQQGQEQQDSKLDELQEELNQKEQEQTGQGQTGQGQQQEQGQQQSGQGGQGAGSKPVESKPTESKPETSKPESQPEASNPETSKPTGGSSGGSSEQSGGQSHAESLWGKPAPANPGHIDGL